MTTTDELRKAVARELCTLMDDDWRLGRKLYLSEADRIIRLVVERCAREARKAGTYERRVWDSVWRDFDEVTEEIAGLEKIIDAIEALAPKEPAP